MDDMAVVPEEDCNQGDIGICPVEGCRQQADSVFCRMHARMVRQQESDARRVRQSLAPSSPASPDVVQESSKYTWVAVRRERLKVGQQTRKPERSAKVSFGAMQGNVSLLRWQEDEKEEQDVE